MEQDLPIDVDFDYRLDTPEGEDPDQHCPRLRADHARLWSKPLPDGRRFELRRNTGHYLHASVGDQDHYLSSDAAVPTYRTWLGPAELVALVHRVPAEMLDDFERVSYTIAARTVFPGYQVERRWTVNQARGMSRTIGDRMDLTLECIRSHYARDGSTNPMADVLDRYRDFFALFGSFEGYVQHFLLQDLVDDHGEVEFFLPLDGFERPAIPLDSAEYDDYRDASMRFMAARRQRMSDVVERL